VAQQLIDAQFGLDRMLSIPAARQPALHVAQAGRPRTSGKFCRYNRPHFPTFILAISPLSLTPEISGIANILPLTIRVGILQCVSLLRGSSLFLA
jgi:hypothetical protein